MPSPAMGVRPPPASAPAALRSPAGSLPSPSQVSCTSPSHRLKLPSSLPVFILTYDLGLAPFLLSPSFVLTLKDSVQRSKHRTPGGCVFVLDSSSSHPTSPQVRGGLAWDPRERGKISYSSVAPFSRDSRSVYWCHLNGKGQWEMCLRRPSACKAGQRQRARPQARLWL